MSELCERSETIERSGQFGQCERCRGSGLHKKTFFDATFREEDFKFSFAISVHASAWTKGIIDIMCSHRGVSFAFMPVCEGEVSQYQPIRFCGHSHDINDVISKQQFISDHEGYIRRKCMEVLFTHAPNTLKVKKTRELVPIIN